MDPERRLDVILIVVFHAPDDAEVVCAIANVWEQITDFDAGLPVPLEVPLGLGQELILLDSLSAVRNEFGFWVESVNVRNSAAHVQENDPLGSRRKVGRLGCQ